MTEPVENSLWPADRLDELVEALSDASGLAPESSRRSATFPSPPGGAPAERLASLAQSLDLEAEPAEITHAELGKFLARCGPAVLLAPDGKFLAVLRGRGKRVRLLGPDRKRRAVGVTELQNLTAPATENETAASLDKILSELKIPLRRQNRLKDALARQRRAPRPVKGLWLLRPPPGRAFAAPKARRRLAGLLGTYLSVCALNYFAWLASWALVGRGALGGGLDPGWLSAWALLSFTLVPLTMLESWLGGVIATGWGGLIKARLIQGALKLDPDELRHAGTGRFLSTVIESETIETMGTSGGLASLVAAAELSAGCGVLAFGAAGLPHALLLAGWLALTFLLAKKFWRARETWAARRLELTHDLVERIGGHRTRLAQEPARNRHDGEDRDLERYLFASQTMDRALAVLLSLVPRGWLVAGFAGLAPSFVGAGAAPERTALSLAGILLVHRALGKLVAGFTQIADTAIAWRGVQRLFAAAAEPENPAFPPAERELKPHALGDELVRAHRLDFCFPGRRRPTLQGIELRIKAGDRILLEGGSGSGKSTLSHLLTGMRQSSDGVLLFKGVDQKTLGLAAWRRHVAGVPQFHENRVFTGTFLFNLLLGRDGPPEPSDIREAKEICRELGLDGLLARMPAGLVQMVGETGWQLSHGEKSRLYMARALLQKPELMILDESFAALDPQNLTRCLKAVTQRADTLLVIAHP